MGPFDTLKVVRFRSFKLSLFNRVTMMMIFSYVVGYTLLYSNRHFVKSPPNGIGRLQLQRPTKHHCNPNDAGCEADFTPLEDLPYCRVYKGEEKSVGKQQPCKYFDEKMMNPSGKTDRAMLIPTRTTSTRQQRTDVCETDSSVECTNIYEFTEKEEETVYVADIERFTLLIDHAFMVPFEDRKLGAPVAGGASTLYQGYFEVCEDPFKREGCKEVKIPCISGCNVGDQDRRLDDEEEEKKPEIVVTADDDDRSLLDIDNYKPNFFSIKVGDVIPMGELLLLAGIDLNKDVNEFGEARRYEGSVLQIDIDYVNVEPFQSLQWPPWDPGHIRYVYRVSMLPMGTFKEVSESFSNGHDVRVLHDWHGIFVKVSLTGSISYVSVPQFILVMTTSVGLLAAAETLVHLLAMYVMSKELSTEYQRLKYDSSMDFDKDTVFQDNQVQQRLWSDYAVYDPKSREKFIDDFKSNDGEVTAMAAHLMWELYHQVPETERNRLKNLMIDRGVNDRVEDDSAVALVGSREMNPSAASQARSYIAVSQQGVP